MMGVNINCRYQDFIQQILEGLKTVETRDSHSLRCYVGKRVGLIRTGKGRAQLVGYATISEEIFYPGEESFRADEDQHQVREGSRYDIRTSKYGYVLGDVTAREPVPVFTRGIIARKIA